ncbi:hypothetical protein [Ulvibacterium marinum]|uniref:Uncharacterized protein n=1 Tax=Ulvibacterium marinum TaxID=2419782 RepID=A0A3B0BZU0_9FLAO|nr:hypothetical protein [Ulvibacterium marinum]RKN78510.1 hypothetical protein D7Z94_20055 [Ulvibacterium marinum]
MAEISIFITIGFILTTIATIWLFFKASGNRRVVLFILLWSSIVGILGLNGFYQKLDAVPPRFIFLLGPVLLFVLLLSMTKKGKKFMGSLDLKWLTLLHCIRVPVELVLYFVFLEGLVPELMTFEGYNFDILSGLTAPILYYLVFVKKKVGVNGLLLWNIICLGLLLNILTIAVLSAQTPIQKMAFDQPNIGVTYFPLVWLPTVVVPIVFLSHLASIAQILSLRKKN